MGVPRCVCGLGGFVILAVICCVSSRALPQGTITQSGEPSHFQVDDKAAEIEVNANPAGVKVNAKPASLQVVAKPGTPAIPVYHPAIHLAPHYLPPPIIHREPAMYFHGHHHHHHYGCDSPYCYGMSRGWLYSGLRRNKLPKPDKIMHKNRFTDKTSEGFRDKDIDRRDSLPRDPLSPETDQDDYVTDRNHKSSIPKPGEHKDISEKTHKRQFIMGAPQLSQPMGLGSLGAPAGYGTPTGYGAPAGYGTPAGYGAQPFAAMANTRAPLARNIISPYSRGQGNYEALGSYGANGLNSLAGYGPLSNNMLQALGSLQQQPSNSGLGLYGAYGQAQQQMGPSAYEQTSGGYGLSDRQDGQRNTIKNFLQSEVNHELYGSSLTPNVGASQGYSRSAIDTPYGAGNILSGRGMENAGSLYGNALGSPGMTGYDPNMVGYRNSLIQLAQMYAAQLASAPGLQQYGQPRYAAMPYSVYPYMGGRSPMFSRSAIPGSVNANSKYRKQKKNQIKTKQNNAKQDLSRRKRTTVHSTMVERNPFISASKMRSKQRRKRQAFYQPDDTDDVDLGDVLQNALVNEYKREMILSAPQPELQQLAALRSQQQSPRIPLPGLQMPGLQSMFTDGSQQQTGDSALLQQMSGLQALNANFVAPLDGSNYGNMLTSSQVPISSMAMGRSAVSPDQLRMVPTMTQRMPMMPQRLPMVTSAPMTRGFPGQQTFIPDRPVRYIGAPVNFSPNYRSPIQYEERRRPTYRRKYGRHPVYRRRLHPSYYDDDYDDDTDDRDRYQGDSIGKESASYGGSYLENGVPNDEGETLVDTNNHGFGPIEVEAKTAEGVRKSLGEGYRSEIAKPDRITKAKKRSSTKSQIVVKSGVL